MSRIMQISSIASHTLGYIRVTMLGFLKHFQMVCGSFQLHHVCDDISSEYKGYLVHFPALSPKNKIKQPAKIMFYVFPKKKNFLYFSMNAYQL